MKLLFTNQTRGDADVGHIHWLIIAFLLLVCVGTASGQNITPKLEDCIPAENGEYATIKDIHLEFDFSAFYQAYPDVNPDEIGILSTMGKLSQAELFKGTEPTGTALAKCYKAVPITSDEFAVGKTCFDLSFDIEQYLEAGQDYVIRFKASVFRPAKKDGTKYDDARSQLFLIHFKGKEAQGLAVEEFIPSHESVLRTVKTVRATFNSEISYLGGGVCLKEGDNVLANATSVTVDESDAKKLVIDFGEDIEIFNTHSYNLIIPAGAIADKNNSSVTNANDISVGYHGASSSS